MLHRLSCLSLCLVTLACHETVSPAPATYSSLPDIVTDRVEYAPTEHVIVTVRNDTEQDFFDDHCSGGIEGYNHQLRAWNGSFGMSRACCTSNSNARLSREVRIAAHSTHTDTLFINSAAYAGDWRVHLRLLDSRGIALPDSAQLSPVFRVYKP